MTCFGRLQSPFSAGTRLAESAPFGAGADARKGACRRRSLSHRALALLVGAIVFAGCASEEERIAEFLERGAAYVEEEKYDEAIIEYKNVLQIDPENATAHEALSNAYLAVDKPREAYWEMSETVRLDPDNIEARLRYGTISAAVGDFDLSFEQADAVVRLEPSNPRGLTLRAQALEQKGDFDAAEADLKAAVEASPDGPAFRFLLGGFYERQKRWADAEKTYSELVDLEPSYLAASALARVILRDRDRIASSGPLLDRLIEIAEAAPVEKIERSTEDAKEGDPGRTTLLQNTLREEALFGAYSLKAAVQNEQGDFEAAMATLEEGLAKSESKVELIYQMARFYRAAGRFEDERRMIVRATEEAPDNSNARLVLSAYLGQQGDLDGALEAAIAAVEADPENVPARLREAELRVDVGFRDGSEESIQQGRAIVDEILGEAPDSPEAHFVRAKIELAEDDIEAAKASLETTLQARPNWGQARFVLGSAMAASGDLTRARVELEAAVEAQGDLLEARRLLTQVYAQLGEHEFAVEQGRAYLAQRPGDVDIRIIVGQSLIRVGRAEEAYDEIARIPDDERNAAALFALGRLDLAYGRVEEGAEKLNRAEAMSPGNAQVLRSLLAIDRSKDQLDKSKARIARAIEANPEDSEILELDAQMKLLENDVDAARAGYQRAIEVEPRNVSAQLGLADLEARSGNLDAMLGVIEGAAAAVPESADLQYRLAQAYDRIGRKTEAIASYEKAITLDPELAMAKNNLAYLLAEEGADLDRALELAQQAKEQLPDDGNAADTLGWVLLKRGLPSAAIGYLQEATERFPDSAYEIQGIVHNHLAQAYELNEESDKAVSNSRRSIEFFDDLSKAAKERGLDPQEPGWAKEARDRVSRLEAAS